MSFGCRIIRLCSGAARCQLLVILLLNFIVSGMTATTFENRTAAHKTEKGRTSTPSVHGYVHNETITTFAMSSTTMLHISTPSTLGRVLTTSSAAPPTVKEAIESPAAPPVATNVRTTSYGRMEFQAPISATTTEPNHTTNNKITPAPPTISGATGGWQETTATKQEVTSSSTEQEVASTTEPKVASPTELEPASPTDSETASVSEATAEFTTEPDVIWDDVEEKVEGRTEKNTNSDPTTLDVQNATRLQPTSKLDPEAGLVTEREEHAITTTTGTEPETYTTSVVSSAPSPGTISPSSEFATMQHQQQHNSSINGSAFATTSSVSSSTVRALLIQQGDMVTATESTEKEAEDVTSTHVADISTASFLGASGSTIQPRITTTADSKPKLAEDDVLVIEDLATASADVQTISVIEIGSGEIKETSTSREEGHREWDRPRISSATTSVAKEFTEGNRETDRSTTSESNDVPTAQWFVLILEGNCSLISRGRQGQRGFKNQVKESATLWLETVQDNVAVTDFHCTSPDRVRANLTVFQRLGGGPASNNVSARLAILEESRSPFMRYHGQDFFVVQILTVDGYLNKEPELPEVIDLQHSNVELVIYIAAGSTCAFLVALATVLLICKYWANAACCGGDTPKPFDFGVVDARAPDADRLTNMRLEDYTLTRIPRPRIGRINDYCYHGLHVKSNYAPLTDNQRRHDKILETPDSIESGVSVRSSTDTPCMLPLEDDTVAQNPAPSLRQFRDGVIVRPMDIRQHAQQHHHYRQLLGGSLGRLYRGARRSAGRAGASKLATVVDADGFHVRSTENLHSMSTTRSSRGSCAPGEEDRYVVDRGVDNPNFQ